MGVYLDHNATSPASSAHLAQLIAWYEQVVGNPSSQHAAGRSASVALTEARKNVARSVGCEPSEVVFVSGGSEANNLATKGVLLAASDRLDELHAITSAIEHPCVLEPLRSLAVNQGLQLTILSVDNEGRIELSELIRSLRSNTTLISIMAANNEIGSIQPVRAFAEWLNFVRWLKVKPGFDWRSSSETQWPEWAKELSSEIGQAQLQRLHFHVDAVQAWGKLRVEEWCSSGFDSFSLCGHKVGGIAGVGALILRRGRKFEPLIQGGAQERSRRAGTENLMGILSLGLVARESLNPDWWKNVEIMQGLSDRLRSALSRCNGILMNSPELGCLPNTLNICVNSSRIRGEDLLMELDLQGFYISSGSACSSGANRSSHVLLAIGRSQDEARNGLRFSLSPSNSEQEIDQLCEALFNIFSKR